MHQIINPENLGNLFQKINGKNIIIDSKTCSIFNESLISEKFHIRSRRPLLYIKIKKEFHRNQKYEKVSY